MTDRPVSRLFPDIIEPGATVAIVSPSSPITPRLNDGIAWLESQGFEVVLGDHVMKRRGVLAGSDEDRLADLHAAWADPGVAAILASGGGYGTQRLLLAGLDFELVRDNPKPLAGFSDITGLHVALWQRLGLVTVHAPNVSSLAGVSEAARQAWLRVLTGRAPVGSIETPENDFWVVVPGRAEGPIVGGNIALVCTLLGTPYELDTRGSILFLENVDDKAYRFDRYLAMLRLAGKLDDCSGVVFGDSVELTSTGGDGYSELRAVVRDHLVAAGKPALYGFPAGHLAANFAFPLGTHVVLEARGDGRASVTFTESLAGPPA